MATEYYRQKRFATKETREQFVRIVIRCGVDKAMGIYKIRDRDKILRFVKRLVRNNEFIYESPIANLRGGMKHMALMEHQATILDLAEWLGNNYVLENFNMKQKTLESLGGRPQRSIYHKTTNAEYAQVKADTALSAIESVEKKLDKLEHQFDLFKTRIELADERYRSNDRAIRQQAEQYSKFVDTVSVAVGEPIGQFFKNFIAFYLQRVIPIDKSMEMMEQIDPLSLDALIPDAYKQKMRKKRLKENPLLETVEKLKLKEGGNNGHKMRP